MPMAISIGLADATIPKADKPGSKDHPLLKRYDGSFIVSYEHQSFTAKRSPISDTRAPRSQRKPPTCRF
jgi:OOP family OmpA-OmpF porin